jgi:hypothetical protein
MSPAARIFVAVLTAMTVFFLLALVRSRRLRAKYALLWLATSFFMVVLTAFPGLLDLLSKAVGIQYGPATLFSGAILLLLLVCMHFSWELSRLEEKTRSLAEELALRTIHSDAAGPEDPPRPSRRSL